MTVTLTKKEAKQKQIAEVATALFQEKGYVATTMKDVANKLGVGVPGLYNHISSKEEVLQNICFKMADEFFLALDKIELETGSFREKVSAIIISHLEVVTKDTAASAVFMHEWKHLSEPHLSKFIKLRSEYEQRIKEILLQGINSGEFIDVDYTLAVYTVISAVNWTHNWYKADGKLTPHQIGDQISAILLNGLCK